MQHGCPLWAKSGHLVTRLQGTHPREGCLARRLAALLLLGHSPSATHLYRPYSFLKAKEFSIVHLRILVSASLQYGDV